jgi:hypothetical protein
LKNNFPFSRAWGAIVRKEAMAYQASLLQTKLTQGGSLWQRTLSFTFCG